MDSKTDMLDSVNPSARFLIFSVSVMVLAGSVSGCKKEEQAVTNVAVNAATAEHLAQAASAKRDQIGRASCRERV